METNELITPSLLLVESGT